MRISFFMLGIILAIPFGLTAQNLHVPETPITGIERFRWFADSTAGPISLGVGVVSAGWGTWMDRPPEDGTQWSGFAKRYGMRLSGVATDNALEAGLGIKTREDPRYFPTAQGGSWHRAGHAATMTFMAYRNDGRLEPAFARYAGIAGGNFISNAWRVPSESTVSNALIRTGLGFASRFVSNLFDEFRKQ